MAGDLQHGETGELALSVVIPARDEAAGLRVLLPETAAVLADAGFAGDVDGAEVIVVDDGSRDATAAAVEAAAADAAGRGVTVRLHRTAPRGQSAAMAAGIRLARGRLVAFLDADGQNDPADLSRLLAARARTGADLVQGDRTAARCDGPRRRVASAVGRAVRRGLLGDPVRDTGCTLRLMPRELAAALPLDRPGLHRFVPAAARALGARVVEMPVAHRPRIGGQSHYPVFGRAGAGLRDCLWVRRWRRGLALEPRAARGAGNGRDAGNASGPVAPRLDRLAGHGTITAP